MKQVTGRNVLVIGATSAIAHATVQHCAAEGARLYLVGRNPDKLAAVALDAHGWGAREVATHEVDLMEFSRHDDMIANAKAFLGQIDIGLVAHGMQGDDQASQRNYAAAEEILQCNFLSIVSLLTRLTLDLERQRTSQIAVISSIAGDRGKSRYHIYATSKGALNVYVSGLRHRLFPFGVRVLLIKLGHVATPMTSHLKQGRLFVTPELVARSIYTAINQGKDTIYAPRFWWWVMLIIKLLPECIFKRLIFSDYPKMPAAEPLRSSHVPGHQPDS